MPSVERLDFSKPPSGYRGLRLVLAYIDETSQRVPGTDGAKSDEEAIAAAWAHFEERNDPQGLTLAWVPDCPTHDSLDRGEWHIVVGGVTVYRLGCIGQGEQLRDGKWVTPHEVARAAAWARYWRLVAVAEAIDALLECQHCDNRKPVTEHFDDGTCSQPWCTECDSEMGGYAAPWPEMLAWSDEQVVAVERWLAEGGEAPEVLRGS